VLMGGVQRIEVEKKRVLLEGRHKPSMVGQVLRLSKEPPPNGQSRTAAHG